MLKTIISYLSFSDPTKQGDFKGKNVPKSSVNFFTQKKVKSKISSIKTH